MLRIISSLLISFTFLATNSFAESIEWTFKSSNIDGNKFDSGDPVAKGRFTKKPIIQNNCLILKGKNYLYLDSIPRKILNEEVTVFEALCKFSTATDAPQGVVGFFNNGSGVKKGMALGRWKNKIGSTFFSKAQDFSGHQDTIKVNQWMHIIVIKTTTQLSLYLDGKLISKTKASGKTIFPKSGIFTFGSYLENQTQKNYNMTGAIHQVKISTKIPSQKDIDAAYQAAKTKIANNFIDPNAGKTYKYLTYLFIYLGFCFALLVTLKHAGYTGGGLILAFIPPVAPLALAFGKWPLEKEVDKAVKKLEKLEDE